jgi:hypothetical protein
VSIRKTPRAWYGTEVDDLVEYLRTYAEYTPQVLRVARCACGSDRFRLSVCADEGGARRTCAMCSTAAFVADSDEYWDDDEAEEIACCKGEPCNVAVGFRLYDGDESAGDVKWIYVGRRCVGCGELSCPVDWKVGYGPSAHLVDQV